MALPASAPTSVPLRALRPSGELAVCAAYLGERIDSRALGGERIAPSGVMTTFGTDGRALVYRHGSVVMFGGTSEERSALLQQLAPLVIEPEERIETEEARVVVDSARQEGVSNGKVVVSGTDSVRLAVVADVLSKSVALARHESRLAEVFGEIEPLARALQRSGRVAARGKALSRRIGASLLMEHQMVGRVEVYEKPDLLWENVELERLWETLVAEYELRDRSRVLDHKLELVARTTQTVLDLLQTRRSLRVEVLIVLLIVVEVLISLYDLGWLRP